MSISLLVDTFDYFEKMCRSLRGYIEVTHRRQLS